MGVLRPPPLGILAEALVAFRRSRAEKGVAGRCEAAIGYGLQLALGYLLMLAAMTYAVELFVSAITGVAIGHALFRTDRAAAPPWRRRNAARAAPPFRIAPRGLPRRRRRCPPPPLSQPALTIHHP